MRSAARMALVVLLCFTLVGCRAAGQGEFLVPLLGPIAPEGSVEECIYRQVQAGLTIKQAIDECAVTIKNTGKGELLDAAGMFGTPGRNATGLTMAGCPSSGADPKRAEVPDVYSSDRQLNMMWLQIELWKRMRESAGQEMLGATTQDGQAAAWGVVIAINDEVNRQAERLHPWLEAQAWKDKNTEPSPVGDFPLPDPDTGTAPARGVQGFESPCTQTLLFVGECNRDGWTSPECRALLDRVNGCLDRTVADPANPDETTCPVPAVDSGKVQDVMMVLCSSKKRYGPDDNPCDGKFVQGIARTYWTDSKKVDECKDPLILRSEACAADVTVVEFGVPDLEEIRNFGLDKLGGPIFIFPTGTPRDAGGPTPKPPPF
jgi:hypothetical protein